MENKMTLKRAVYLIVFIIIVLCVIISGGLLFSPKNNTRKAGMHIARARGFYGEKKNTIQVLGLGNSDLFYALNPLWMYRDQGFTSFMASEELQTTVKAHELFTDFLKTQSPKLVVIETNEFFLRPGTFEFNELIKSKINEYLPMTQYHTRWKSLNKQDFTLKKLKNRPTVYKGFKFHTRRVKFNPASYCDEATIDTMDPIDAYYLDKIMKICKEKGIQVLFMTAWAPADWSKKRSIESARIAKKYGVNYLDFNDEKLIKEAGLTSGLDGQPSDFKDYGSHMNYWGAQKMSDYVGKYIAKNYHLKDVRKNPDYASWNRDLAIFEGNAKARLKEVKRKRK